MKIIYKIYTLYRMDTKYKILHLLLNIRNPLPLPSGEVLKVYDNLMLKQLWLARCYKSATGAKGQWPLAVTTKEGKEMSTSIFKNWGVLNYFHNSRPFKQLGEELKGTTLFGRFTAITNLRHITIPGLIKKW